MSDFFIRRMTLLDVSKVALLEAASFAQPWSEKDFVHEMTQNPVARYLVASDQEGELLGFAGAHIIFEEGHVTNVVVAQHARGQGIGRALMQDLMQYAANLGCQYLTLEVRVSNAPAISLYQSLGFVKVSVRKKYYQVTWEDALLMVCDRLPAIQEDFTEGQSSSVPWPS